jgi:hypothetical protein
MIKFKKTCLLATVMLFSIGAYSQTVSDPLPDSATVAALESLETAQLLDSTENNVVYDFKGMKLKYSTYEMKDAKGAWAYGSNKAQLDALIKASPSEKMVLNLINLLRISASYVCSYKFSDGGDPNQTRIAYSWGSKEFMDRANPPGEGDNCTYKIRGLDCSGFIYQIFKMSGINFQKSDSYADMERSPAFLKRELKSYFGDVPFDVVDKGKLEFSAIQSGDIIYIKNSNGKAVHILIALVNNNGVINLYQSLGSPNRSTTNSNKCVSNLDANHGTIVKLLTKEAVAKLGNYGVVRTIPK